MAKSSPKNKKNSTKYIFHIMAEILNQNKMLLGDAFAKKKSIL